MRMQKSVMTVTVSGLLVAVGIIIPMFSPVKILLEPASFTLASHVAVFIAMFISPYVSLAVAVGTTIGFFLGGFPVIVVIRAASHFVFASAGAFYFAGNPTLLDKLPRLLVFSFGIALIHAVSELLVVFSFYFVGMFDISSYRQGTTSVVLLVGLGTVIHSMVDMLIAYLVMIPLRKAKLLRMWNL